MKHIKTPVMVRPSNYAIVSEGEDVAVCKDAFVAVEIGITLNAHDALFEACKALLDLATWASGAPAFNPGGDAREGWIKVCSAIDKGFAALAKVEVEC